MLPVRPLEERSLLNGNTNQNKEAPCSIQGQGSIGTRRKLSSRGEFLVTKIMKRKRVNIIIGP